MKHCGGCSRDLPETGFHASVTHGLQTQCKDCQAARGRARRADPEKRARDRAYQAAYREAHADQRAAYQKSYYASQDRSAKHRAARLRRYGLGEAEFAAMLGSQGSACAICAAPIDGGSKTHIDHCHVTGLVRGLLCFLCNNALGLAHESPARLRKMADYVERKGVMPR